MYGSPPIKSLEKHKWNIRIVHPCSKAENIISSKGITNLLNFIRFLIAGLQFNFLTIYFSTNNSYIPLVFF